MSSPYISFSRVLKNTFEFLYLSKQVDQNFLFINLLLQVLFPSVVVCNINQIRKSLFNELGNRKIAAIDRFRLRKYHRDGVLTHPNFKFASKTRSFNLEGSRVSLFSSRCLPLFSGFYDNETLVRIMYEDFIKGKYSTKHFIYTVSSSFC